MSYDDVRPVAVAILTAVLETGDNGLMPADVARALASMDALGAGCTPAEQALVLRFVDLIFAIATMYRSLAVEAADVDARALLQRYAAASPAPDGPPDSTA